jgi:hypothetical protein
MKHLALFSALIPVIYVWGRALCAFAGYAPRGRLESALSAMSMGIVVLALLVFGLNSLHLASARYFYPVLLFSLLAAAALFFRRTGRSRPAPLHISFNFRNATILAAGAVLGIELAINLLACLAPPTGPDTLKFHLLLPWNYVSRGGFENIEHLVLSGYPLYAQMTFETGLLMGSDRVAVMLSWLAGPLSILLIIQFARKYSGIRAGIAGALIFYSLQEVNVQVTTALADLYYSHFALLSL